MHKKINVIILLLFVWNLVFSQQIPITNQNFINKTSILPAISGYNGNIESFLTYRQNWIGIEGAPSVANININGNLNSNMGFGFNILSDKSGNYSQNYISATYSYHLRFSDKITLSTGLSPLFYRNQLNLTNINSYGNQLDPMLNNIDGLTVNTFDIGISMALKFSGLCVGFNIPQTIGMNLKLNELGTNFGLKRHYFGYVSYYQNIKSFAVEPSVIIRTTEKSPINIGGGLQVIYKNKLRASVGYSADNSILLSVGALSGSSVAFSYSYEFGIGGIAKNSLGTHEITVGFLIKPAQNFLVDATVFGLPESVQLVTDNKTAEQIKKETAERIAADIKLQKQIDSLSKLIGNQTVTQIPQEEIKWVQKVVSTNITFEIMSEVIFQSSFSELDKYTQKLRQDPELKIKIMVYTDNLFSENTNLRLSERRAKSVAEYFLSKPGIKKDQVQYVGMGSENPIADNTTPEGREKNNRVEFMINKKVF